MPLDFLGERDLYKTCVRRTSSLCFEVHWQSSYKLIYWQRDLNSVNKSYPKYLRCEYYSIPMGLWYPLEGDNQRRQWHPTPVLLPGKSHGQRSLVACSPWDPEEWDMTERLHFHFSLSCIGEGNGSPLQCSCLENPRDGGAWGAAIYGVAQSRTRLKRLSSSSSSSRRRRE